MQLCEDVCVSYLIKEQDEVDGEANKQSQETEVVEVTSQIILQWKCAL